MPDFELQIAEWRRQMVEGGVHDAEVLEELEEHLREDIAAQVADGTGEDDAMAVSAARLGMADQLSREFAKIGAAGPGRVKTMLFTLAGIPPFHHANTMNMTNTPSLFEPRWATYTKAALFLTPALVLWTFAEMFLMPKLQHICQLAGVQLPWLYQVTTFIANHALPVIALIAVPILLLECRWNRWPQFRRASLGSTVFLLNAAVLTLITLMVIFALSAAPSLMQRS